MEPDIKFCGICGMAKMPQPATWANPAPPPPIMTPPPTMAPLHTVAPPPAMAPPPAPVHDISSQYLDYRGKLRLWLVLSIIGYVVGAPSLLFFILTFTDQTPGYFEARVIFLIFLAPCVFFIVMNIITRLRIRRLKQYFSLISGLQITSLVEIASRTDKTVEFVKNDIQKMINSNLLNHTIIDYNTDEVNIIGITTPTKYPYQR